MIIELEYLYKLGLSLILGLFIGWERENNDKDAGLRTITFITLGATLVVLLSLRYAYITKALDIKMDGIRAMAYYLVAIGFVGGGMITRKTKNKIAGITTASLLLPMSIIGLLCGIGEAFLAVLATLIVYFILKLKYIRIKIIKGKKRK